MNPITRFLYSFVALPLLALSQRFRRPALVWLANAAIVNITHNGRGTKTAGPAVTFSQRYLIASRDPADGEQYILPYVAGTNPFCVVPDMTPTTDTAPSSYPLPCNLLGTDPDTQRMIAGGTVNIDDLVYAIVGGTVKSAAQNPTAGNVWIVGKCLVGTVTGSGDQIEVQAYFPYQANLA
jgi:hypothetical protein